MASLRAWGIWARGTKMRRSTWNSVISSSLSSKILLPWTGSKFSSAVTGGSERGRMVNTHRAARPTPRPPSTKRINRASTNVRSHRRRDGCFARRIVAMDCYYTGVKAPSPLRPLPAPTFRSELLGDLEWRGLLANVSDPADADRHFLEPGRLAYIGFDPTADSLHVGSLLGLVVLRRIQRAGHRPVLLIGGGTGLIGDPSGKSGERALDPEERVAAAAARLKVQVQRFLDFDPGPG